MFDKKDGFKYEISGEVNNKTLQTNLNFEHKIGVAVQAPSSSSSTPSTSTRTYTTTPIPDLTRNQYYPPSAVAISKSANKYQSSQLILGAISEDTNNMYFKLVYKVNDKFYEV